MTARDDQSVARTGGEAVLERSFKLALGQEFGKSEALAEGAGVNHWPKCSRTLRAAGFQAWLADRTA